MSVNKLLPICVLLFLFVLSLFVRADVFRFAPLGLPVYSTPYQRQENTEVFNHVLYVMTVYRDNPVSQHFFAPYIGSSPNFIQSRFNADLFVYPSFSPILFIVPYLFLTITHIGLSYMGLQIFSLFIHLICIFLVYYLVMAFLPKNKYNMLIGLLSASVYAFATNTLQSHMDVWWAHQLLQPFYLGAMLLFVRRNGLLKWWESLIIGFVLSLITWTGLIVSLCLAVYYFIQYRKHKDRAYLNNMFALLGGMAAAVLFIASQVLFVTGTSFGNYVGKIFGRVQARSAGADTTASVLQIFIRFVLGTLQDAGAYLAIALGFLIAFWKKWRRTFRWTVIAITLFPLLESIPLLEHDTIYSFGRLKLFIPLILILALGSYEFLQRIKNKRLGVVVLSALFVIAALIHVFLFLDIYTPKY